MKQEKELLKIGYDSTGKERAGSFIQTDHKTPGINVSQKGIEILPIQKALKKYPALNRNYYGKAFVKLEKDYDKNTSGGYFIRIAKGVETTFPIQACLYLKDRNFKQKVHNLIIVEEGAKAYLLTGCGCAKTANEAHHIGISEFFVHKNAYLNFTMIHSWREKIDVKPKSVAIVKKEGVFISNYVSLSPVRSIYMYPACILNGERSKARFNSIILGYPGSVQDIGSRVIFEGSESSAEIISRAVSLGGDITVRGHLKALCPGVKAHLECRGLMLSEKGRIHAIPELETDYRDVTMSHEAAIGKISKEEIEYLATRGISEEQAQSIIVRGFMDARILGLPPILQQEITKIADRSLREGL